MPFAPCWRQGKEEEDTCLCFLARGTSHHINGGFTAFDDKQGRVLYTALALPVPLINDNMQM